MTNKKEIEADIQDWGIDSDFVRIRWLGIFPQVGANQFIGLDLVQQAQRRHVEEDAVSGLPLVMGVDVARHGDDRTVMRWRQGPKLWKKKRVLRVPDLMRIASEVAREIEETQPDIVFLDMVGVGAGVYDLKRFPLQILTELQHLIFECCQMLFNLYNKVKKHGYLNCH